MNTSKQVRQLPNLDELESLFVNNPDLQSIKAHIGRFNPIKVMGMQHMEIRHSAILGWLLDPQESHGLSDTFLKAFLAEAMRGHDADLVPSALDISKSNMMDAEVRREWRSIDLLVLSPANSWVFVIENKFHSTQHGDQLNRYMQIAKKTFIAGGGYQHLRGVFLTLWDEAPDDVRYAPINYDTILRLLEQVQAARPHPLAAEVAAFINHYLQIIRETVHMDDERLKLEKLARDLYREHKKVLDFVVENGQRTDFIMAAESVFGEDLDDYELCTVGGNKFIYSDMESAVISFLPEAWYSAFGGDEFWWHGCEEWWAGFPLITWMHLITSDDGASGQIRLYAEVGPVADHSFRSNLIEAIQSSSVDAKTLRVKFQRGATDEGKKYSRFFKGNAFPVDDVHDQDNIASVMKTALEDFRPEFDAVAKVLPQFLSHGKMEGMK